MDVLTELRRARERAGLSQRALASALGTTQSAVARLESGTVAPRLSTIEAYGNAVGRRLSVERTPLVPRAAATLTERYVAGDADGCLRALIQLHDDLTRTGEDPWQLLNEPARVGDPRWDSALAATVELAARTNGWPTPGWTAAPSRRLDAPWFPLADILGRDPSPALVAYLLVSSPTPFAARGIFVDAATFVSC